MRAVQILEPESTQTGVARGPTPPPRALPRYLKGVHTMKWVFASVIAVVTAVCSGASAQSIPSEEPGSALLQTVQYGGYNDFNGYSDYNGYGNRGYGYSRPGGGYNRGYRDRRYRDQRDDFHEVISGLG